MAVGDAVFGLLNGVEDGDKVTVQAGAFLRQGKAAGGAVDEADAEAGLQPG